MLLALVITVIIISLVTWVVIKYTDSSNLRLRSDSNEQNKEILWIPKDSFYSFLSFLLIIKDGEIMVATYTYGKQLYQLGRPMKYNSIEHAQIFLNKFAIEIGEV